MDGRGGGGKIKRLIGKISLFIITFVNPLLWRLRRAIRINFDLNL